MSEDVGFLRTIEDWELIEGAPAPLGATWVESQQAYNFALYSRSATGVLLLLYTEADPIVPVHQIQLDPQINKTGRIWHCWVPAAQVNDRRTDAEGTDDRNQTGEVHQLNASIGGHVHTRLRSPKALSTRATGGQYL